VSCEEPAVQECWVRQLLPIQGEDSGHAQGVNVAAMIGQVGGLHALRRRVDELAHAPSALNEIFSRYRDRLRRMVELRLDHRLQARMDASDVIGFVSRQGQLSRVVEQGKSLALPPTPVDGDDSPRTTSFRGQVCHSVAPLWKE
jgi:hypothetical protein